MFGSGITGEVREVSNWDIVILTEQKYPKPTKWLIHDKLFPLSLAICSVFSSVLATNNEWQNHPAYYSLHTRIGDQLYSILSRRNETIELKLRKLSALMSEVDLHLSNKL